MKLKDKFSKAIFIDTLKRINKERKLFFYVVLMDIFFLASLFVLRMFFDNLNLIPTNKQQAFYFLFLGIAYNLLFIFAYSFFKHIILSFIKSTFKKSELNFERLTKFFMLNIAIFIILFFVFLLLGLFASGIKEGAAPWITLVILFAYFALAYVFVNISHVLFFEKNNIKESLSNALKYLKSFKSYYGVYLSISFAFLVVILLFSIFGNILKFTLFQDYSSLLKYGNIYEIVFVNAVGIIFYIAILFNRFYFYNLVKKLE